MHGLKGGFGNGSVQADTAPSSTNEMPRQISCGGTCVYHHVPVLLPVLFDGFRVVHGVDLNFFLP